MTPGVSLDKMSLSNELLKEEKKLINYLAAKGA